MYNIYMNYVYLASGLFGAKVLEKLQPKPAMIITQADKLGGRGMTTKIPTEVKRTSQRLKIPTSQITKVEYSGVEYLKKMAAALVCDFGLIIPKTILELPQYGFWNIHPSLLPKYRGAAPIQSVLLNGEKETGVTIIQMDEQIDHGPILAQAKLTVSINDTSLLLIEKLSAKAASLFNKLIRNPQLSISNKTTQNHNKATYTQKLRKQDGFVEFKQIVSYLQPLFKKYNLLHLLTAGREKIPAKILHNKIRALNPWPGVWTTLPKTNKILKILDSFYEHKNSQLVIKKIKIEAKVYNI